MVGRGRRRHADCSLAYSLHHGVAALALFHRIAGLCSGQVGLRFLEVGFQLIGVFSAVHGVPVGQHFSQRAVFGFIPLSGCGGGFVSASEEEAAFEVACIDGGACCGEQQCGKQDFFHERTR